MYSSERLQVGQVYTRDDLRQLFGINDSTINNGIFRPKGHDSVWLFVTEEKTEDRTQYADHLDGDVLEMDGQTMRRTDKLVIDHRQIGLELLLFHRMRKYEYEGAGFRYEGPFLYAGPPSGWVDTGRGPTRFRLVRERPPMPQEAAGPEATPTIAEGGQGLRLSPAVRQKVEEHAMAAAERHFSGLGYSIQRRGKPYDLHCTRGAETLYVEVKGTTTAGEQIVITHGEYLFNQANPGRVALFVLQNIELVGEGDGALPRGGIPRVVHPWSIEPGELTPISYLLSVPRVKTG